MIHNHILLQLYFSSGMIQNALPPAGWNDQDYPTLLALLSCLPSSLQIIHLVSEVSWCNKEGALGEVMNIPPYHPILCCDLINWWSTLCIVVSYRMIGMRSALLGLLKSRALKKPGPGLLEMQPNKGLCTFIPLLETFRLPNFSLSYLQCQLEHPCSEVNTSLIHYCEYNYNLYLIGLKPKIQLNLDLDGCFTSFLKDKIKWSIMLQLALRADFTN